MTSMDTCAYRTRLPSARRRRTLAACAIGVALATLVSPSPATTLAVTSVADSGPGTLRQAIHDANGSVGMDDIVFAIPGAGVHTIRPVTAFESATSPVSIDGYTQPGASPNTNGVDAGSNAALAIEIDASLVPAGIGIEASNSVVRGLVVNRAVSAGISIGSAAENVAIEGNYIGTDATGTVALGNGTGVFVAGGHGRIGGTTPTSRNVISGNRESGVSIVGSNFGGRGSNNRIEGNLVGTDASGTRALGNGVGIYLPNHSFGGRDNVVGGPAAGARNLVSGNTNGGIVMTGDEFTATPANTRVVGNRIGTDIGGALAVGNGGTGVLIGGQSFGNVVIGNVISGNGGTGVALNRGNVVEDNLIGAAADGVHALGNGQGMVIGQSDNRVGGTTTGTANTIAFNLNAGVRIADTNAQRNAIVGNAIHHNGRLGIDLLGGDGNGGVTGNDPGDGDTNVANLGQNFPVITMAVPGTGDVTVSGSLNSRPNATYRIELFASRSCDPSPAPGVGEYGEGETFIGAIVVTTDASGDAPFGPAVLARPPMQAAFAATATDAQNNTSEFSACIDVGDPSLFIDGFE